MMFVRKLVNRIRKMKNFNVLIWICWVVCLTQILALSTLYKSLPDIPANGPLITLVDQPELRVDSELNEHIDDSLKNATAFVMINNPNENDPELPPTSTEKSEIDEIPSSQEEIAPSTEESATKDDISAEKIKPATPQEQNNTEDGTIPVFSEWAQKQMQEAEQKQKEEEENGSVVIPKSQRQHNPKHQVVKLRAKNYASPDCGAKILASNADAQSTGSVLTASKDEYLLSPCTSRIWFVVELCEPIQAEKIDLANFELFSSSPKNFTVGVSNRFPTRDWSNVGHFTAKDERDVQTFVLHPQLFGKFVRVDIQSHYNSEHYCPVSLFRVYGTSEFEAFETENQPTVIATPDDLEDEEEEDEGNAVFEPSIDEPLRHGKKKSKTKGEKEKNILKTAGEAVMNMVKKAAEALSKTNEHQNRTLRTFKTRECVSVITPFLCNSCPTQLSASVQQVAACYDDVLTQLAANPVVTESLSRDLCAIFVDPALNKAQLPPTPSTIRRNYVATMLPLNISIGVCNKIHWEHLKSLEAIDKMKNEVPFVEENHEKESKVAEEVNENEQKPQENAEVQSEKEEISHEERIFQNAEDSQPPLSQETNETEPETVTNSIDNVSTEDVQVVIDAPPLAPINLPEKIATSEEEVAENDKIDESPSHETIEINGNNSWENLETLLASNGNGGDSVPTTNPTINHKQGQPESVFLRLSNRIKSLERNMSLSGQYLEELSRRYKKQVEELQQSFAKTLHHIEEQNRKNTDREQQLYEQNLQMRHDLNEVIETLQNWKIIVTYCGGFLFVQLLFMFFVLRNCSRRNNLLTEALEATIAASKKKKKNKGDLKRRKSIDGTLHSSPSVRQRRPSEEALKITGHYEDLLISSGGGDDVRNIGSGSEGTDFVEVMKVSDSVSSKKKKNKEKIRKTSTGSRLSKRSSSGDSNLLRGESPAEYDIKNGNLIRCNADNKPIEEMPYLEDNDEFIIPTASELSYNEYVPSMSSSQRINGMDSSISDTSSRSSNTKLDKSRRLSSPAFFKSALGRSSTRKSLPPVVQTSGWEWYRLRKSKAKSESPDVISVGAGSNISTSTPIVDKSDANSDEASSKSKKAGGSFRRILKKVF
ncbi:SUN domain-containing ossification factor isoform X2 [Culicoides brevitarsis]|uniref:SUN domain-containing ossification factor isoform X2 n=1 Tax=Culicoides brevitarsis TaxID=469753 RepID=UPI00307C5272